MKPEWGGGREEDDAILNFWVVYDHPRDLPEYIVVRRHVLRRGGTITVDARAYGFIELERARAWLQARELTCIPRDAADDPTIIESWL